MTDGSKILGWATFCATFTIEVRLKVQWISFETAESPRFSWCDGRFQAYHSVPASTSFAVWRRRIGRGLARATTLGGVMKKSTLVTISLIGDLLDIAVVGQIPGLSWFIDIPIIICHVAYAGPSGFSTMLELIPVVGTLPLFTVAALVHKNND
jgi:hypothetical protein